jgi:hypothetical protein
MARSVDGKVWVRRTYPKRVDMNQSDAEFYEEEWYPGKEDTVPKVIEEDGEKLAVVKVGLGMTINLGNYESARVDVGVELPCRLAEVPDAYGLAWAVAEREIRAQIRTVRNDGDEGGKRGR